MNKTVYILKMVVRNNSLCYYFFLIAPILGILLMGCAGCGGVKKNVISIVKHKDEVVLNPSIRKDTIPTQSKKENVDYEKPKNQYHEENPNFTPRKLTRFAFGKNIEFEMKPDHLGGEAWTSVWKEVLENGWSYNRICQLSPTVLLYRRFPSEIAKDFYYADQAEKLEFFDSTYNSIKTVDLWENRPYQDIKNAKLTYHHFDSEMMQVIPYNKQEQKSKPNEYSLFTYVKSEGMHVIVNYELRSLITTKQMGKDYTTSKIIGVKHTIHIYDLQGNLKYVLKDLPSVDEAVVSNNGEYMMFTFGGIGILTTNNPFGTMDREGWALMRLKDQEIVYQEYTDDGVLAFNRLWIEQGLLSIAFSTPSSKIDFDRMIFYNQNENVLFLKNLTRKEFDLIAMEYKNTGNMSWENYCIKLNFQQIPISEK